MGETVDDKIRLNYFLSLNEFSMLLISAEKALSIFRRFSIVLQLCRVITIAYKLSDTTCRHLRVLRCEIHRYLTYLNIIATTALAEHMMLLHIEVFAYLLKDIIDSERMIINLHGSLNDTLCKAHVDIRIAVVAGTGTWV